jgi:hypothetical protein
VTPPIDIITCGGLISAASIENVREVGSRQRGVEPASFALPWAEPPKSPAALEVQCQSDLERQVLHAIHDRGLPLPDGAQETLYDTDESPLAVADFYYRRGRVVVFVDGSPHYRDYVQVADERKRRRLKALGYRIVVVTADEPEAGLEELAARVEALNR